jgi:hypothetical protein
MRESKVFFGKHIRHLRRFAGQYAFLRAISATSRPVPRVSTFCNNDATVLLDVLKDRGL